MSKIVDFRWINLWLPGWIALEYFDDRYWWTSVRIWRMVCQNTEPFGSSKYQTEWFVIWTNICIRPYLRINFCDRGMYSDECGRNLFRLIPGLWPFFSSPFFLTLTLFLNPSFPSGGRTISMLESSESAPAKKLLLVEMFIFEVWQRAPYCYNWNPLACNTVSTINLLMWEL